MDRAEDPSRLAIAARETRATCCYCGTGCGLYIEHSADWITGVRGDAQHPANFGRLCTKGSTLHLTSGAAGRALYPELRTSRETERARTDWGTALDTAADRFADIIREHGPDAVAFYLSGQLLTEDYYVFNKLARALVGTNNIDSNSRLCMSSAVVGYKSTLGADSVPCSYEDIALADHLLIAGSNTAWAHPILFRRIEDAKRANPHMTITVVDPRRTETAEFADLHLQIAPGADMLLYNAMLHVMMWEDLIDRDFIRDHTNGFDELRAALTEYSPGNVAAACGLKAEEIVEAARRFGTSRAALSMWCQGLNQSHHGAGNNAALIHLHLATGQIGRPGAGPLSLTGQPNAMGGREVGALASILPGHRDPNIPAHREEIAKLWGIPKLPESPGLAAVQMYEAIAEGKIKAVWIACTNPAQSMPNQREVHEALRKAEFVVLQETYADTETAEFADLLLPAAGWGEKSGTVTNSERRVTRVQPAIPAVGESRADWAIAADFARRLARRLDKSEGLFDFQNDAEVFDEHVTLTAGRDCDMSGLSHAVLERLGPTQWPFPQGAEKGVARLFEDHVFPTEDGRARFARVGFPERQSLTPERTSARRPFMLTTGRLRDQWHGMSRSGKVPQLWGHTPRAAIAVHPVDLVRRDFTAGALVRIKSERGEIVLPVEPDDGVAPGQAWIPMHWGGATLAHAGANFLTSSATDPMSKQPALKQVAVSIAPATDLEWRACWAAVAVDQAQAVEWMDALRPHLKQFGYAAISLAGRQQPVVALRTAHAHAMPGQALRPIDDIFGCEEGGELLRLRDGARGIDKRARIEGRRLLAIRLGGETVAFDWIADAMIAGQNIEPMRQWLFASVPTPPKGVASVGRTVCNCFGVSEKVIRKAVAEGADLNALQHTLQCGTSCGSCMPELRKIVAGK